MQAESFTDRVNNGARGHLVSSVYYNNNSDVVSIKSCVIN